MANEQSQIGCKSLKGNWGLVRCELWHLPVIFCIGSRQDMHENACEAINNMCNGQDDWMPKWGNSSIEFLNKWMSQHGYETDNCGETFSEHGTFFLRLDDFHCGYLSDIGVLAHECLHVAISILRYIDLKEEEDCEGLCYTFEHIFTSILESLNAKSLLT